MTSLLRKCFSAKTHRLPESLEDIHSGKPGSEGALPSLELEVELVDTSNVSASVSGPEGGIDSLRACAPEFTLPWDKPNPQSYGRSISMYDRSPTSGICNGDPIADCFGVVSYQGDTGAILAVADGVNWGEPAKRAARCAVLGALQHMHDALTQLGQEHTSQQPASQQGLFSPERRSNRVTSNTIFKEMIAAIHNAQRLIIQQRGTLTTLVLTVILPHANHNKDRLQQGRSWLMKPQGLVRRQQLGSTQPQSCGWACMTITVGDSAAWVWRSGSKQVQELTAASHAGEVRDVRFVPGVLGHALGEDPDLSNMTASLTLLKPGDVVLLASDGIADNYDPVVLQMARAAPPPSEMASIQDPDQVPALTPQEMHVKHLQLFGDALHLVSCSAALGSEVPSSASNTDATAWQEAGVSSNNRALQLASTIERGSRALTTRDDHDTTQVMSTEQLEGDMDDLTMQQLVDGLLELTYKATEPLRLATMEKSRAALAKAEARAASNPANRSLATDTPRQKALMPPGKLDHATVCAFRCPQPPSPPQQPAQPAQRTGPRSMP